MGDLEPERGALRPLALRAEQRARKGRSRIKIEMLGPHGRIERRTMCGIMRQRDPPFDGVTVDLAFDVFDREAIRDCLELDEVDDVANVRKYLGEALDAVSDGMPADFVAMTLYAALGALQEGVIAG